MALSAKQILAADDRPIEEVHVPEWATGGDDVVCLRPLDGSELYKFQTTLADAKGELPDDLMVRVVASCACDEQGNRLFTAKQIAGLAAKSGTALRRLFEKCQRMTLLDPDAAADFPEGSGPTTGDGTGSGSPSTPATGTRSG